MIDLPSLTNGSFTSGLAKEMMGRKVKSLQALAILECVYSAGELGRTAQEIEDQTGIGGSSVRPRLIGLEKIGLLTRKPNAYRATRAGRLAEIWIIPEVIISKLI